MRCSRIIRNLCWLFYTTRQTLHTHTHTHLHHDTGYFGKMENFLIIPHKRVKKIK